MTPAAQTVYERRPIIQSLSHKELMWALKNGDLDEVKALLVKGAVKERKGPDGLSAFEAAESEAIKDLLK
uniref:Myotrophin n=1 Tax=Sinocyclocheilus rhinocerous TaxID=307959 RepID=A0A673NF36_9TELE